MEIKGVYSPVITIMNDAGEIDFPNMEKHIDHLASAGLNGLLFFGSLGEFYAFSKDEKKAVIDLAVKVVKHRAQVIIGVGGTSLADVLDLAGYAAKAGADAVNIVSPFYFGPTEEAAIEYFGKIAEQVAIPIQLYNFPARVGADLTPHVIKTLAEKHKNIIGVKDTVDNISHTRKVISAVKAVRPEFSVLSGFDEYYLVNRASGGDGVLCGLTNVVPELFVKYHKAYEAKDFAVTEACAKRISKLMRLYDATPLFIVAIKAAVKARGLDISTYTRAPGMAITEAEYKKVQELLADSLA